jgi:hypothetical protein
MDDDILDQRPYVSPQFGRDLFLEWRSPRFGNSNPSNFSNPVWEWLIKTRKDAYFAAREFRAESAPGVGPCWCFKRFGRSTTVLTDGRKIHIAGEHEDSYDPDFCIYNDVVVENLDGTFQIFGYPREVFPPTDFHTATLIGGFILLVGNLGYHYERNFNNTQVLRLNIVNFQIEKLITYGDNPGWIHEHSAKLSDDGQKLIIDGGLIEKNFEKQPWENVDEWELDLLDWTWARKTDKQWQRWCFVKKGGQLSMLFDLRMALHEREYVSKVEFSRKLRKLTRELGYKPQLDLIPELYRFDESTVVSQGKDHEYDTFYIYVDNTVVRFKEDLDSILVLVEGRLAPGRLRALQESVYDKLKKIEGGDWEIEVPESGRKDR